MTCRACTRAATDRHCPDYQAGCQGCEVRAFATGPKWAAQSMLKRIRAEQGERAAADYAALLTAELARVEKLKYGPPAAVEEAGTPPRRVTDVPEEAPREESPALQVLPQAGQESPAEEGRVLSLF